MKTISKTILDFSWPAFIAVIFSGLLIIPVFCGWILYLLDGETIALKQIALAATSSTIGASINSIKDIKISETGELTILAARLFGYIWLAVSTAFLVARIGENRKKPRLSAKCAVYYHDGSGHLDKRPGRYLLEFRLIVFPNPPIYKPDITVTLYLPTESRGRDQCPLELTPVQANKVSAYLNFRAILPNECLIMPDNMELEAFRKLPEGSVDVCINMIDSANDRNIFIYNSYKLPHEAKSGVFGDAVTLGDHGEITFVDVDKLELIEKK
jgi:hypothetical protein